MLLVGYQGMKDQQDRIPAQGKVRLVEALERLVQLHEATGNKEEAQRWRKALEQERVAVNKPQPSARGTQQKEGEQAPSRR